MENEVKIETKPEGADFDKVNKMAEQALPNLTIVDEPRIVKGVEKKYAYSIGIALFLCLTFSIWNFSVQMGKQNIKIAALDSAYQAQQTLNSNLTYVKDSLDSLVKRLSVYRNLTDAMYYRDDVRMPFKHRPGDLVYLKVDSSRVLVIDMLAGGDKNNYTFKYRVQYKDRTVEEISPDLIY